MSKKLLYVHWHYDPVPFADPGSAGNSKNTKTRLIELAVERGLLPKEALRFKEQLALEIENDLLLAPLDEKLQTGGLRAETTEFVREHVSLSPPELATLVRGEEASLEKYVSEYRAHVLEQARAWRSFLDRNGPLPNGWFSLEISEEESLERWLRLVAGSPLFPEGLARARERLAEILAEEAKKKKLEELTEKYDLEVSWSRPKRVQADEGYSLVAKVTGTSAKERYEATFSNVFDFGLVIGLPGGPVYRNAAGEWFWRDIDRKIDDPHLCAFLEVAYLSAPRELRLINM